MWVTFLGGAHNKEYNVLGSILGSPYIGLGCLGVMCPCFFRDRVA